jgi:hypothetical protein
METTMKRIAFAALAALLALPAAAQTRVDAARQAQQEREGGWQYVDMTRGCVPLADLGGMRSPDDMLALIRKEQPSAKPLDSGRPGIVLIEAPYKPEARIIVLIQGGAKCRATLEGTKND